MVAANAGDGLQACGPLAGLEGFRILDVRHEEEIEARPLKHPAVTRLPLDELRERRGEIEPGSWVVVCERGPRAAEAVRLLNGCGVEAVFLGGGMRWRQLAGCGGQPETAAE